MTGSPELPALLADRMLARLARYLRTLGLDVAPAPDGPDALVLRAAEAERRRILTRDRALASRAAGAIRIRSVDLAEQLREVQRAIPSLPRTPTFVRCTLCNGELRSGPLPPGRPLPEGAARVAAEGRPFWHCPRCGHVYWEGSHTTRLRADVARWLAPGTA